MMTNHRAHPGGNKPPEPPKAEIERFVAALPIGRQNARTAEQLAQDLGLLEKPASASQVENAKRRIRLLSEYAVFRGYVYCADNDGYYRPDADEMRALDETIGRRESQAHRTLQWCSQMRANVTAALHQGTLL